MRLGALLLLSGCGIRQLLPEGPVLSPTERASFREDRPSGAAYDGPPAVGFPVMPVIAWGAAYDLDLVMVDGRGPWDMHEYARLVTPDGPIWLAKDARLGTLDQTVVADLPDIASWLPELPIERKSGKIEVEDRSGKRLDLTFRYTNIDGKPVVAHYEGKYPTTAEKKRNGSTMGHSRRTLLAVLDVSHMDFGRGTVEIDGNRMPAHRLAGILPFRAALIQAQGGLATGSYVQTEDDRGFWTRWASGVVTPWAALPFEEAGVTYPSLVASTAQRTLVHMFQPTGDHPEWTGARVYQHGREVPVLEMRVTPSLPDLRRHFPGHHRSRYVIDVNGQEGHATGWLDAWWEADGPRVALIPEAPWWTVDRPMLTTIHYENGTAKVDIVRTPTDAKTGAGGRGISRKQ